MASTFSADGLHGAGLLVAGIAVSIPSALVMTYLEHRRDPALERQKIEVETLAKSAPSASRGETQAQKKVP
ncbi:MAG TPA: hypothetical protein VKQ34_02315 [Candidatus Saccharimonadales bacterium]|nr:hypothetical protein [Candidatus Saccharimonadales bacterium]